MTASELTQACPECDSTTISSSEEREESREWFCGDCRTYFPDPKLRAPRVGVKPGTTAAKLLESDPDDIGRSA